MNYLLFGGEGFIGTHLKQYLLDRDASAKIYSLDIVGGSPKEPVQYIHTDVRKPVQLTLPTASSSIIFNLAAVHKSPGHADSEYYHTNVPCAENICRYARENNINTIVFTSSIAAYGTMEIEQSEASVPMPNAPYGMSKLAAEYIHRLWQAEDPENRKLIIVRPGVVFGKGEEGNFARLYRAMRKRIFFYPGRKDTIKAAVYVKDVVRILYEMAAAAQPGVSMYNLAYHPAHTIAAICNIISEVTGVPQPRLTVPAPVLMLAAKGSYRLGRLFGKKVYGIDPQRVSKLMVSTNVSGEKLANSPYALRYSLKESIEDWFEDCNRQGLF